MGYFKNLKEKWEITEAEKIEIEKLQRAIDKAKSPYRGKQPDIIHQSNKMLKESEEAKKKILLMNKNIKARRIGALLGK